MSHSVNGLDMDMEGAAALIGVIVPSSWCLWQSNSPSQEWIGKPKEMGEIPLRTESVNKKWKIFKNGEVGSVCHREAMKNDIL